MFKKKRKHNRKDLNPEFSIGNLVQEKISGFTGEIVGIYKEKYVQNTRFVYDIEATGNATDSFGYNQHYAITLRSIRAELLEKSLPPGDHI